MADAVEGNKEQKFATKHTSNPSFQESSGGKEQSDNDEHEGQNDDHPEDENTRLGKELFHSALKTLNSSALKKANGWAQMNKAAELGNTDAKVKIAFAKLFGNDYFTQNLEEAKTTFQTATNNEGHPEAQFGLGFLYATGTMTNSSQATALLYYTFAAFGGNAWAQMALGYVCFNY